MTDLDQDLARIRSSLRRWGPDEIDAGLRELHHRREANNRLERGIAEVQARLRRWGPAEVEAGLEEFRFRRGETGRRQRWVGIGAVVVAAAAAMVLVWVVRGRSTSRPTVVADQTSAIHVAPTIAEPTVQPREVLALGDGSEITLLDRDSHADITETKSDHISVALTKGRAQFRVKHTPGRAFVVQVGTVRIEDLGTTFVVERGLDQVVVTVSEGALRVTWDERSAELTEGERGIYPVGSQQPEALARETTSTVRGPARETWRVAAREGRYGPAFSLLQQDGFESVRDEPSDLLLAADVARLSGHAADAVAPLRKLLRRYRRDPRSPAAAFTLGSVLMRDLGRPREAASAFADAERLAPGGNLAEDSAARAAEAWHRAGDQVRARAELQRYAAAYPKGRYLSSLRPLIEGR